MKTVGSRAEVWHGTAKKTSGGLLKKDLKKNKRGRIVSKKMSNRAKKEKRLEKAGYKTKKGVFKKFKAKKRGGMNGNNNELKEGENSNNNELKEGENSNNNELNDGVAAPPPPWTPPIGWQKNVIARNYVQSGLIRNYGSIGNYAKFSMTNKKRANIYEKYHEKNEKKRAANLNKQIKQRLNNLTEKYGRMALIEAVKKGNKRDVKILLDAGNKQRKGRFGSTPLHWAARQGRTDIVELLLDAGANKDVKNEYGSTPLNIAADRGFTDIVMMLLDAGADKEVKDTFGFVPLHWAAAKGHTDIVMMLLDAGADINVMSKNGTTPLHLASAKGDTDIVMMLLDAGADKDVKDKKGKTPLHYAEEKGHTDVVKLLESHNSKGGSKKRRKRKTTKRKSKK